MKEYFNGCKRVRVLRIYINKIKVFVDPERKYGYLIFLVSVLCANTNRH